MSNVNCRSEIDNRCESVSKKIREAEIQKIPYMLVVGEKEVATAKTQKDIKNAEVSVRSLGKNKLESIKIDKFIDKILKEIKEKK